MLQGRCRREKYYNEYLNKLRKIVEECSISEQIESLEDELLDCGDLGEVNIEVLDDDRVLRLVIRIYGSSWSCLPSIRRIDEIFKTMYMRSNLERSELVKIN